MNWTPLAKRMLRAIMLRHARDLGGPICSFMIQDFARVPSEEWNGTLTQLQIEGYITGYPEFSVPTPLADQAEEQGVLDLSGG